MQKYLLWWAGIWIIIGGIVYAFAGKETPEVLYGVALAAFISLIFLFKMLYEEYEGEIVEVKEETYYSSNDEGGSLEKRLFATILMPNGKNKKVPAINGYKVGNYLKKVRGEATVKLLEKKPEYYKIGPERLKR